MTGARAGRAIEHRNEQCSGCRGRWNSRRQHPVHRYGEGCWNPAVSKNPRHVRTHSTGTWEVSMLSRCRGGNAKERETVTDDARHGEVRLGNSSCEVGEQRDFGPGGVDGAKGRAQGESGKPKHAPGAGPGKRVTSGRPDTAIRCHGNDSPSLPKGGAPCPGGHAGICAGGSQRWEFLPRS